MDLERRATLLALRTIACGVVPPFIAGVIGAYVSTRPSLGGRLGIGVGIWFLTQLIWAAVFTGLRNLFVELKRERLDELREQERQRPPPIQRVRQD